MAQVIKRQLKRILSAAAVLVVLVGCSRGEDASLPRPALRVASAPQLLPAVVTAGGQRLLLSDTNVEVTYDEAHKALRVNPPGWWVINYPFGRIRGLQARPSDQISRLLFGLPADSIRNWYVKSLADGIPAAEPQPPTGPAPIELDEGESLVVDNRLRGASDSNPGSRTAPLRTISAALDRARPGMTIWVYPGIYREKLKLDRSGTLKSPIRLEGVRSPSGELPVISGNDLFPVQAWGPVPNLPGVYRAELPAGHAGTVSAGARTLIERSLPGELQPGEFAVNRASLEFLRLRFDGDVNPEAGTTTDGLVWRHLRTDSDGFLDLGDAYGAQAGKAVFWASTHVWVEPRKESLVWNPGYPEVITGRLMTEGEFRAFRISGRSLKGQVNSYRLWVNGRLLPATVFSTEQDFQLSLPHPDRNYGPSDTWENFRLRTGWNHLVFQFDTSTRPDRTRFKFGVPERIDAVLTSAGKPSGPARPTAGEPRPYLSEYLVLGPFSAEEKDLGVYVRLSGNANPNHVSMDMAARPNAIVTIEADFVQLRGFEIRHGTQSQQRAQVEITGEGIVVEGNLIRASEFGGIKFVADRNQAAAPIVIRNNWILNPGNVGISGSGSSESLTAGNLDGAAPGRSVAWIEDNTIVNSNWAGFPIGWQAGGVKLMKLTGAVIRYNTIIASNGPGIWLDWEHYGNRIEGNLIARAYGYCIGVEGSPGPNLVANNLCQRLRPGPVWFRAGILSWDSQRTWAVNNTVDGGWNQQKGWQGYVGSKGIDLVQDPTRRNNRWGETTVSDHVYVNNLIVGCRQALQSGRTDLVEANYTDRGTGSQSVGEVGFLGRERGDYRIRTEDSLAARGKETTHTAWVPHDFYGLLRFPDQPHGVGAFRTDPRPQPGQSLLIEVELEDGSMRRFYDVRPQ